MAKKQAVRKTVKTTVPTPSAKRATKPASRTAPVRRAAKVDPLLAPVRGAERRKIGGVTVEVARAGAARVKRVIYPAGFRWSRDIRPLVGTELCMHAHVGFIVQGEIHSEYPDGCVVEHKAPQVVSIEPGHEGWVVGKKPVVLIEFDFENQTVRRLGMPKTHRHA